MKDPIYVVDPSTKKTIAVQPTTFYDLNVKERQDLQAWLMNSPDVLGEPLLLITSEFDKFDKSEKRLDLLLLDRDARIVVAELKLDASGTLADQQAIRYAAFCSTMTMDDVVGQFSRSQGYSLEESVTLICEFLETSEMPPLNGEPRILLVAGSFADQELTSTVMWLRKFGVDISCIELTPYRYPGDTTNILLVPKILIPLSEARDYQISVERKERSEITRETKGRLTGFFSSVLREYSNLNPVLAGPPNPAKQDYMCVHFGKGQMHYEWLVRKRKKYVDIAIHFEGNDQAQNDLRLQTVLDSCPNLRDGLAYETVAGQFGVKWSQFCFRIPYSGDVPDDHVAKASASLMIELINRTYNVVRNLN